MSDGFENIWAQTAKLSGERVLKYLSWSAWPAHLEPEKVIGFQAEVAAHCAHMAQFTMLEAELQQYIADMSPATEVKGE